MPFLPIRKHKVWRKRHYPHHADVRKGNAIKLREISWKGIRKLNKLMVVGFSVVRNPERKESETIR